MLPPEKAPQWWWFRRCRLELNQRHMLWCGEVSQASSWQLWRGVRIRRIRSGGVGGRWEKHNHVPSPPRSGGGETPPSTRSTAGGGGVTCHPSPTLMFEECVISRLSEMVSLWSARGHIWAHSSRKHFGWSSAWRVRGRKISHGCHTCCSAGHGYTSTRFWQFRDWNWFFFFFCVIHLLSATSKAQI